MSLGRYLPKISPENCPSYYLTASNAALMMGLAFSLDCGKGVLASAAVADGILTLYLANPQKFMQQVENGKKLANLAFTKFFGGKQPEPVVLPINAPRVTKRNS